MKYDHSYDVLGTVRYDEQVNDKGVVDGRVNEIWRRLLSIFEK